MSSVVFPPLPGVCTNGGNQHTTTGSLYVIVVFSVFSALLPCPQEPLSTRHPDVEVEAPLRMCPCPPANEQVTRNWTQAAAPGCRSAPQPCDLYLGWPIAECVLWERHLNISVLTQPDPPMAESAFILCDDLMKEFAGASAPWTLKSCLSVGGPNGKTRPLRQLGISIGEL